MITGKWIVLWLIILTSSVLSFVLAIAIAIVIVSYIYQTFHVPSSTGLGIFWTLFILGSGLGVMAIVEKLLLNHLPQKLGLKL
jgi:hypothetical protein